MLTPLKDPEAVANGLPPTFLLRLSNADELQFHFTFVSRQQPLSNGASTNDPVPTVDTQIAGLTYIFASSPKEVDNLVVREFHANPNLHKNSNVELVGDYTTGGSASVARQQYQACHVSLESHYVLYQIECNPDIMDSFTLR